MRTVVGKQRKRYGKKNTRIHVINKERGGWVCELEDSECYH